MWAKTQPKNSSLKNSSLLNRKMILIVLAELADFSGPTARHENVFRVNSQSVNDGIVSRQVLDEVTVGELPLFYVV